MKVSETPTKNSKLSTQNYFPTFNGKPPAMKRDIIREKILSAAEAVFERHGFDKTILEDLGREAGMNKTSLYYYFRNKDEIFAAVIHRQSEAFLAALEGKIGKKKTGKGNLKIYLEQRGPLLKKLPLLHKAKSHPFFAAAIIVDALTDAEENEITFLRQLMAKSIKNGELKKGTDKGAKVILTALNALNHKGKSAEKDVELFIEFLLEGIGKKAKEKAEEVVPTP